MKRLLSFFILFIYSLIVFGLNSMGVFALHEGMMNDMHSGNMNCCEIEMSHDDCINDCCIKGINEISFISFQSNNFSEKILKVKLKSFIDIFTFSLSSFDTKNLVRKTSPPLSVENNNLYSYVDLIKIIKSNT